MPCSLSAAPKGLVKKDELPSTWGLLEFQDDKLQVAVPAPLLPGDEPDRGFIAALLRRRAETDEESVERLVCCRLEALRAGEEKRVQERISSRHARIEEAEIKIRSINQELGINLFDYQFEEGQVVAAFRFAMAVGFGRRHGDEVTNMKKCLDQMTTQTTAPQQVMTTLAEQLQQLATPPEDHPA